MEKKLSFLRVVLDILFPRDKVSIVCDSIPVSSLEAQCRLITLSTPSDCIAFFPYTHPLVRAVIHAMKYHGHPRPPELFGKIIAPHIAEEIADRRMFGTYHTPLVVPVPLHKKKLRIRGFNQSERIARAIFTHIGDSTFEVQCNALIRTQDTHSQAHHKNARSRFRNMRGAFSVPLDSKVKNKDIILIDDVVTTGATLLEAKRTLLDAGARNVWCVAVAH